MAHEQTKVTDKAKGALKEGANKQVGPEFDRPLGSSHNDKVDLRDVARLSCLQAISADSLSKPAKRAR